MNPLSSSYLLELTGQDKRGSIDLEIHCCSSCHHHQAACMSLRAQLSAINKPQHANAAYLPGTVLNALRGRQKLAALTATGGLRWDLDPAQCHRNGTRV